MSQKLLLQFTVHLLQRLFSSVLRTIKAHQQCHLRKFLLTLPIRLSKLHFNLHLEFLTIQNLHLPQLFT
jgi:hypothetical protein